mgnify:FL=1
MTLCRTTWRKLLSLRENKIVLLYNLFVWEDSPKIQVRYVAIDAYLNKPDFDRANGELPGITPEERKWLARLARNIYTSAKTETNEEKRLQLMARFYDCLTLILCDPSERKMASYPPDVVERTIFIKQGDCLSFGTGTIGERIYFETKKNKQSRSTRTDRYMIYYHPTDSATNLGRKYFKRFNEVFGTNEVNLDAIVLEELED